jgi:hypothetical protein
MLIIIILILKIITPTAPNMDLNIFVILSFFPDFCAYCVTLEGLVVEWVELLLLLLLLLLVLVV